MAQFLTIYTPAIPSSGPPSAEHMAKMGELIERMSKKNALVTMGATTPGSCEVRLTRGNYSVIELPQTGEQGFAILQAGSRQEAIELIKEFLAVAGDVTSTCHPLMGPPPQA